MSEPGWAALAGELIQARQTVLPKRLAEPGPDPVQWQAIVAAAAAAPDHKQLQPWRLVLVPEAQRGRLAEVFAQALIERDPIVSSQDLEKAREKAHRAPLLALLVVDAAKGDEPDVDWNERVISAGCAVQNMLLMATAQGFGSALTSGKALKSAPLRALFGLTATEQALCFVNIGSVTASRPGRARPAVSACLSVLGTMSGTKVQISLPGHSAPGVGFEQPFEMLEACHERVERMLRLLGKLREHSRTHGADQQARDAARDVMRYFDQAGPHHHEDEERHVFPPLLAQRDPAVLAVVIGLKQDHSEMAVQWALVRAALSTLVDAGGNWAGFSTEEEQRFDAYDALYRRHLVDENGVVYPEARKLIRGEALQAMSAEMMGRRGIPSRR